MPRKHKYHAGSKPRKKYLHSDIMKAVEAVKHGLSYRKAEKQYGIPKSVINRHKKEPETKTPGWPVVLGDEVVKMLVDRLKTCAEWGFPMDCLTF